MRWSLRAPAGPRGQSLVAERAGWPHSYYSVSAGMQIGHPPAVPILAVPVLAVPVLAAPPCFRKFSSFCVFDGVLVIETRSPYPFRCSGGGSPGGAYRSL